MNYLRRTLPGLAALVLCACGSPQGKIMTEDQGDLVGAKSAGSATFSRLIAGATNKLLEDHSASTSGLGQLKVACLDVQNRGIEELSDWREQIYELIATSINQSDRYRTISREFVNAVLRETRLRPDELYIPAKRRLFLQTLETENNPVQVVIIPRLTTGTTDAGSTRQRDYLLTLELIDVVSGENRRVAEKLRKEYFR